jgi:ABC-type multidrug transport system ATPase subunit
MIMIYCISVIWYIITFLREKKREDIHLRELPITMFVSTYDMKLMQDLFPRATVMDEGQIVACFPV